MKKKAGLRLCCKLGEGNRGSGTVCMEQVSCREEFGVVGDALQVIWVGVPGTRGSGRKRGGSLWEAEGLCLSLHRAQLAPQAPRDGRGRKVPR